VSPATLRIFIFSFFLSFAALPLVHAQSSGSTRPSQVGAFIGNLLPNGVDGVNEITPLWGFRYSHPVGRGAYAEGGGIFGNSKGVMWQGAFASMRMDIPVETLVATAMIGLDFTRYSGEGTKAKNTGGGHAGGGLMSEIGDGSWIRFDMKLNSKPGTSLYFALGLMFELGSSGGTGPE
jgi:hypothetical protein